MSETLSKTNINQAVLHVGRLLDEILAEIQAVQSDFERLDYYKKQLLISESRIKSFRQNGEEPSDPIKSRKIKLVLKIDEIESAMNAASALMKIVRRIDSEFREYDTKRQVRKRNSVVLDQFNNKHDIFNTANQTFKMLSEKVISTEPSELAKVINEACILKGNEKVYVLHKKLVTKSDLGFHEAFFSLIKAKKLSAVLQYSKVEKQQFTLSEMLSYYVFYALNRDSMNF